MPPAPEVAVIRTGTANMASVLAGLERAGARAAIHQDAEIVIQADFVVLPGVGALQAAMVELRQNGLDQAMSERIRSGRPSLCVCLGLQLLFAGSEESPGVPGLGVLPGRITRFPDTVVVPQMGWNRVQAGPECRLIQSGWAYFANSYRLEKAPDGWAAAVTEHAGPFVSAIENGALLACQFHPELSGAWGLELIRRWLGVA
jgi:glutamine amidotransferase